ncbi:Uma2 family endonuclease [Paraliomyxa miuraensis]|uniref:Uma2 family endonuclease n=1 Tax=Paraliomyxa miuraensis TaxID=376150 RepID=UPI0022554DAB|nr:Uma2 family endonuclease [Paraliomyxa miuraensis]MCX4247595.1 Uma2 family endonuclease [Paraliomyxa miuraensis]
MAQAAASSSMTEDEYLAFERASQEKHEYANGELFAMSGGTGDHAAIAANLIGELRNALFGRGCRVHTSDMRVKIPNTPRYVYPDASVVCSKPEYADDTKDTLTNPQVVIEVLSESTEAYDRGEKFAAYQTIPSMAYYVIASQTKPRIEIFTRQDDGGWLLRTYGAGELAALPSLSCSIEVDRIYTDVLEVPSS